MSKKKLHFSVLSTTECSTKGCKNRLKQRIVDSKPTAHLCYRCYLESQARRGNHKQPARKYVRNPSKTTKPKEDKPNSRAKRAMRARARKW